MASTQILVIWLLIGVVAAAVVIIAAALLLDFLAAMRSIEQGAKTASQRVSEIRRNTQVSDALQDLRAAPDGPEDSSGAPGRAGTRPFRLHGAGAGQGRP